MTKRPLKLLHELGSAGVMGGVAMQGVLASIGWGLAPPELAYIREAIWTIAQVVTGPSLAAVMLSGVLAMGLHKPFHNAQWVMVKVLMTPLLLEGSFLAIFAPARAGARLAEAVASGDPEALSRLERVMDREPWGLGLMMVLFTSQVVFGVWRPPLAGRRRRPPQPSTTAEPAQS